VRRVRFSSPTRPSRTRSTAAFRPTSWSWPTIGSSSWAMTGAWVGTARFADARPDRRGPGAAQRIGGESVWPVPAAVVDPVPATATARAAHPVRVAVRLLLHSRRSLPGASVLERRSPRRFGHAQPGVPHRSTTRRVRERLRRAGLLQHLVQATVEGGARGDLGAVSHVVSLAAITGSPVFFWERRGFYSSFRYTSAVRSAVFCQGN